MTAKKFRSSNQRTPEDCTQGNSWVLFNAMTISRNFQKLAEISRNLQRKDCTNRAFRSIVIISTHNWVRDWKIFGGIQICRRMRARARGLCVEM